MAVTKIWICLNAVFVIDDSDFWGPGEWYFTAKIDGKPVGDPNQEFVAVEQQWITLPSAQWSMEIDVSARGPGSSIPIAFKGREDDIFFDDNLGEVSVRLKYPYKQEMNAVLPGSIVPGGIFSSDRRYYWLNVVVKILEEKATVGPPGPAQLFVNRQASGTDTITTASGTQVKPRVEICPVVPTPAPGSLPPRPAFPVGFAAGKITPQAAAVPLTDSLDPNALPNPAVIPILSKSDPDMAKKAARVAVTYIEPGNLDTSYFTWFIKKGPAAFFGDTEGKTEVLVYGTGAGATDQEAVIELRWDGAKGPVLATFRAWVGKARQIPYRALIVTPSKASLKVRTTPADAGKHIAMANALLWHAALQLVPDSDATVWDGAVSHGKGIFEIQLPAKHVGWSVGVNDNLPPVATRLNFQPGVLHICYIKSSKSGGIAGVATDRPQLSGANEILAGTPSPSWVRPSGVPPDGAAGSVTMQTMSKSVRGKSAGDKAYLHARKLAANAMDRLFGLILADYTVPSDPDWGQTIAHETGHVLGLRHRGNAGYFSDSTTAPPTAGKKRDPSDDGINDPNGNGYPWWENIMCYGYTLSQDFDILQSVVIRRHPALK